MPPEFSASLEDMAVRAGLIQAPPPPRSTSTPLSPIVYVVTSAPESEHPAEQPATQISSPDGESPVGPTLPEADASMVTQTQSAGATLAPVYTPTVTATSAPTATRVATLTPVPGASLTAWQTPSRTPTRTSTRTATLPPTDTPEPTAPGPSATPQGPSPTPQQPTPTESGGTACDPTGNSGYENTVLDLINQARQDQGLSPYNLSGQLRAAARSHSQDMACNDTFSHTGSDGSSVGDRVSAEGYSWSWVGENIFATSSSSSAAAQQAFEGWMDSSGHKANILSSNFTEIGIGYSYTADSAYGSYFTAVFARP